MQKNEVEELYRKYLLDFMKNSFDMMIEGEVLSFEDFEKRLSESKLEE